MRVLLIQPTYLPWSGYFGMIDKADLFIDLAETIYGYKCELVKQVKNLPRILPLKKWGKRGYSFTPILF